MSNEFVQRLMLVAVLALAAAAIAALIRRRQPPPPMSVLSPAGVHVPTALDRADFPRPEAPWLAVLFSSATCDSCAGVWERVQILESADVAVANVEAVAERGVHQRYRIDSVPILVIVDRAGAVERSFVGPVNATDLWGAVADLRDPDAGNDASCHPGNG